GLYPLDVALHVALPEFDGRIITVPVSFKSSSPVGDFSDGGGGSELYAPLRDRADRIAGLAARLIALRRKPNSEKRIAFVLTNSPAKASRIGNAVGLDAPESLRRLLLAMRDSGYTIAEIPESGDALIHALIDRCSYDTAALTPWQLEQAAGQVAVAQFMDWQGELPDTNQNEMRAQWGEPPNPGTLYVHDGHIALPGLSLGNVFIALQPPRGFGADPNAIYHSPDLTPTYQYHALYRWLREPVEAGGWGADALVHLGKHGTLEWLPGKGIGLSQTCYPDLFLDDLPLVYPFILNNPGEGAQAKRRTHAVIIDHMTPPLTQAGMYGGLYELAQLVDEYYQVEALDPSKLPILQRQIWELMEREHLDRDLAAMLNVNHGDHSHAWDGSFTDDGTPTLLAEISGKDFTHLMEDLDGYLCELGSATIRDGLHILGYTPEGEQLIDTLNALTQLPNLDVPSLRASVARALGHDLSALLETPGKHESERSAKIVEQIDSTCRAVLRDLAATHFDSAQVNHVISHLQSFDFAQDKSLIPNDPSRPTDHQPLSTSLHTVLTFVCNSLAPNLRRNTDEITNLLRALNGEHIPPGPSGAPTRGMAHVLPTGRNFYTVDPRSLPSPAAWQVGERLADELIRRYQRDEGKIPETVGLSIWGTSAIRTHGDDIAQVFALLGARPRWQAENKRIVGVDVIPLDQLNRPRVDVVCRISGFFRDAFPHLITLMDQAVRMVSEMDEPLDQNFVRKHVVERQAALRQSGLSESEAARRARYRLFGSKPGAYGAGILPLIDERNWRDNADFAQAYLNWGGYAYTETEYGAAARDDFARALSGVNVAAKNQDNREHDIFDSDDYLQYHGGMIAAIRALTGRAPRKYFGDNSDPARPRVRDLKEEALRVFRSRVVNPKWIESVKRHGYKGGLELTATVDYVFGYDATADIVDDWMYAEVAERYALDPATQAFLRESNPWALRDMLNRLTEAIRRGMWDADDDMQRRLGEAYLTVDGDLEDRLDRAWAARHLAPSPGEDTGEERNAVIG
ncbi:MAG: cobaltochelatase subunit CobN, partial [Anaerolineales bacterium]